MPPAAGWLCPSSKLQYHTNTPEHLRRLVAPGGRQEDRHARPPLALPHRGHSGAAGAAARLRAQVLQRIKGPCCPEEGPGTVAVVGNELQELCHATSPRRRCRRRLLLLHVQLPCQLGFACARGVE